MKRTLLMVALLFGASCAMAQTENRLFSTYKPSRLKVEKLPLEKKTSQTKEVEFISTVDFSNGNSGEYELGTAYGHQGVAKASFKRVAPGESIQASYPEAYGFINATFGSYEKIINRLPGYQDGYALVSAFDAFQDGGNKLINTTIKLKNPISTIDMDVVDVYFNQITMRFNQDKYFIDWSTDPNFSVYDSLEFNIDGLELNVNDQLLGHGQFKYSLPVGTSKVNSIGQEALYIRLRYFAPVPTGASASQSSGYFWLVDDIKVANGKPINISVKKTNHSFNGYGIIPQNFPIDTLETYVTIENTGNQIAKNVQLEEKVIKVVSNTEMIPFRDLANTSVAFDLGTERKNVEVKDNGVVIGVNARRDSTFYTKKLVIPTDEQGTFLLTPKVKYGEAGEYYSALPNDTVRYIVTDSNTNGSYAWARDQNMLLYGEYFTPSRTNGLISLESDLAFKAGYEVCVRYETAEDMKEDNGSWYFKGIELVAAAEISQPGVKVQGLLKKIDPEIFTNGGDQNKLIIPVKDAQGNDVKSIIYTTTAGVLNNNIVNKEPYYTYDYRTIWLPFTDHGAIKIEAGQWYYACYKLIDDGDFAIAADNGNRFSNITTFKPLDYRTITVFTPGQSTYSWGDYMGGSLTSHKTPSIRFRVSQKESSINNNPTSSVYDMNCYPNPASSEVNINYSLKNSGNVVLTVSDIMGREVVKMNQGNQSANNEYKVSLNTNNLANGTYFYTINVNGVKETKKLVINK